MQDAAKDKHIKHVRLVHVYRLEKQKNVKKISAVGKKRIRFRTQEAVV